MLNVKHDVIHEFIINLWSASKDHEIASVLWVASIHDSVVYIVSLHDCALEPLIVAIADEALAILKVLGAVHLSMGSVVWTKCLILANGMLHHGTTIVHLGVDYLATSPLFLSEWCLVNVKDLVPSSH